MRFVIYRDEAEEMSNAHAEGWHTPPDGQRREGCPDCEDRPLASYPIRPTPTKGDTDV
jgi:hypothetical protein